MTEKVSSSPLGEKLLEVTCKASISPARLEGNATAEIWTNGLLLKPKIEKTLYLPFVEILAIRPANYRVSIATKNGVEALISQVGLKFDPFAQKLVESWGDALARALLMHEPVVVFEGAAEYNSKRENDQSMQSSGNCRARIYQTSLVLLPAEGFPFRFPFSSIASTNLDNYKITITMVGGGTLELFRLGRNTEVFFEKLTNAQRDLERNSIETIKALIPSIEFDQLRALANLMVEGRAAMRKDVEGISSDAWRLLANRVTQSPLADSFQYISSLSNTSNCGEYTAIGLKKTMETVYLWFIVLVKGSVEEGGNSLIMEVTSETGHATYLFKVMSRTSFTGATDLHDFQEEGEAMIARINEAMVATGFRREPIYLSDDRLNSETYSRYLYASKNLPALNLLRERFFARIIHSTPESWKRDLTDALVFNTHAHDDQSKWSKSDQEAPEDVDSTPSIVSP